MADLGQAIIYLEKKLQFDSWANCDQLLELLGASEVILANGIG